MHEPDQHVSPITNWKQLVLVVVLAFIVPIAVIIILTQWVTGSPYASGENESAVLNRIKPVGDVLLASANADASTAPTGATPAKPAPTTAPGPVAAGPTAVAASAGTAAAGGKPDGKKIYDAACGVCHGAGVAGAPKFGDKAGWAPRIKTGIDTLYSTAIKGKGAMPPKGGNASLGDADIKSAVDYMVAAGK